MGQREGCCICNKPFPLPSRLSLEGKREMLFDMKRDIAHYQLEMSF